MVRGGKRQSMQDDGHGEETAKTGGGGVRLKAWSRCCSRSLGEPTSDRNPPPLIDCLHKPMQLWKAGDRRRVDGYIKQRGLWRLELFARLMQAVLDLADGGSEERSILESIQNHLRAARVGPSRQHTFRLDVVPIP